MKKPIPSYTCFGKNFIQFYYVGQPKTCRLCHSASHFANACHTIICFNCEKTGHLASNCPTSVACNICKATNHLACKCPFSWTISQKFFPNKNQTTCRKYVYLWTTFWVPCKPWVWMVWLLHVFREKWVVRSFWPSGKLKWKKNLFVPVFWKKMAPSTKIQDVDHLLTFVQVFDAPHELPNTTIIQHLAPFCEVVTYCWGFFWEPGWENVQDGSCHCRVRMNNPIPSYMQFGKIFVQFPCVEQPKTCGLCHSPSHFANACYSIICFNCEKISEESNENTPLAKRNRTWQRANRRKIASRKIIYPVCLVYGLWYFHIIIQPVDLFIWTLIHSVSCIRLYASGTCNLSTSLQ